MGKCPTVTQAYCSDAVTRFTNDGTIADVFEVVVASFDQDYLYDISTGVVVGAPITFTATISGNVATITLGGITQTGTDIPLSGNVDAINLLVRDRYWSVDGGVQGRTVLKRFNLQ